MKIDSAYMADQNISEVDNWNYIHNINYLLANCDQDVRYNEGLYYAKGLKEMEPIKERINMHRSTFFYQGTIVPGVMEMRFGFWDRAIERFNEITNADSMYSKPEMLYKEALTLFSSGMLDIERNDAEKAELMLHKLDALLWRNSQLEDKKELLNDYWVSFLKVAFRRITGQCSCYKKRNRKWH